MTRAFVAAVLATGLVAGTSLGGAAQTMTSPVPSAATPLHAVHVVLGHDTLAGLPRRTVTVSEEHGGSAT